MRMHQPNVLLQAQHAFVSDQIELKISPISPCSKLMKLPGLQVEGHHYKTRIACTVLILCRTFTRSRRQTPGLNRTCTTC